MGGQMLAGVGRADITCRAEGTQCELLSEKTKAHIPREFWDNKIEIDDPLYVAQVDLAHCRDGPGCARAGSFPLSS